MVSDPIPASLKYVSAKASAGSCAFAQAAVACDVGDIPAGGSVTVTVVAKPRRVGGAGNTVSAVSRTPDDPNTANNVAGVTVKAPAPRLSLRKTASRSRVPAGGRVTFRLRLRNVGGSRAHHVTVCDRMPGGLAYVGSSPRARARRGAYCWTLASLAPHRSETLKITARALSGARGRRVNRASATAQDARTARATRMIRIRGARSRGGGVTG